MKITVHLKEDNAGHAILWGGWQYYSIKEMFFMNYYIIHECGVFLQFWNELKGEKKGDNLHSL